MTRQPLLALELYEETAVLIPWQRHCHELAVALVETLEGWHGAFSYIPKATERQGLCMPYRGPYCSREAAIRNSVAIGCHHLHPSTPRSELVRLYQAAGIPIPPRFR